MNVAIYLRKSREEENETREETLARHERILIDYCSRNNLIIKQIYKEVVSGENLENRPQARKMLEDVANNLFDGVVVVELERLSRGNQLDQVEILEVFKKSNTKIYTLNKTYDLSSDNEFDEEFFEFGLFMSRREYKIIRRRLIRGRTQASKEGYFTCSNITFGFDKERQGKGFVLVPNKNAEVVKLIFNKFVYDRWSYTQIRDYLNNQGIKPAKKTEWNSKMVKKVLKCKTYIGYIYYLGEYYPGKHKAIIDIDTFNLAQEIIESKMTRLVADTTLVNPFSSILKCGFCGGTIVTRKSRDKHNLMCNKKDCNGSMRLQSIEKKLIEELQVELDKFNYYIDNYDEELEKSKLDLQNEKDIIIKEITKKENMIERCCEMLEEGIYTKEKYLTRVNILETDLKALKVALNDLEKVSFDKSDNIKKTIPILSKVLNEYWNLTPTEKNILLKSIIKRIEYKRLISSDIRLMGYDPSSLELKIFLKI